MLTLRGPSGFRSGAALSDLGLIGDGAVLIRDGVISCIGTSRRIENLREARGAIEIPAHGRVVLPAFVDQGLALFLADHRMKSLIQARSDASLLLKRCLQHGSVSTEIEAGGTDSFDQDLRLIRQGAKVADNCDVSLAWRISADHTRTLGMDRLRSAVERLMSREWVRSLTLSDSVAHKTELRKLLFAASSPSRAVRISGEAASSAEIGRSFPQTFLSASVAPNGNCASVLEALAHRATAALFRPLADLLHPETQPLLLKDFVERGGIPVLAAAHHRYDSPGFNMQAAIALAVLRHGLTPEQAITAATNNAAWSLGWGHDRGTIEVGKRADVLILNVDDYREIPRQFGSNHVGMVIRRGAVVFNRTSWREFPQSNAAVAP